MPLYGLSVIKPYFGVPSGAYNWFNLINVLRKDMPITVDDVLPTQADKDLYELTGYYGGRNWKAKYVDTVAHELSQVQDKVYAYYFKWGGLGSGPSPFDFIYGAGHAAEIPFFFGADQGLFGYPFVHENEGGRKDLQKAMMAYLSRFAHTGNPNALCKCPAWLRGRSHSSCLPRWKEWSNHPGAPKSIVFDADFDRAQIEMMNEELTVEGVTAELDEEIKDLSDKEKAAARFFQFSKPW